MAEKIVRERMEPAMKTLDERVAMLEQQVRMGTESVESFAREKPMMALGVSFLIGAGFGLLFGMAVAKAKD